MALSESLRTSVTAAVETLGLDCEDIVERTVGKRLNITVVVDKDGGVDLDTIADVSSAVSAVLDDAPGLDEPFVLEVTSPGVDRPLTHPRHWTRALNRLVEISVKEGSPTAADAGVHSPIRARITSVGDDHVSLRANTKGREYELTLPFADVEHAVVQVEFSKPGEES